jgi:hypothetical protein
MAEESTTPDPVVRTRRAWETADAADFDGMMTHFGSHPIWDMSSMGLGVYQGVTAVRRFLKTGATPTRSMRPSRRRLPKRPTG